MKRRAKPGTGGKSERNQMICARLRAGETTISDLAGELGVSRQRVQQIAARDGITAATYEALLPPSKTAVRAQERAVKFALKRETKRALFEKILGMRRQGLSQTAIGKALGRSQKMVSQILLNGGVRAIHQPIRVFAKPNRQGKASNRRIGAPPVVGIPKHE